MTYTIDESLSDTEFTAAGSVAGVFGTPRRFESITIHHWGSFGQTHNGVVDFFVKRNANTSAHFVVSDGRIHCLVSPQNASWAAGNAYGNATSIHIECRPEATEGDYATVAWLVDFLRAHYGENLPLRPHNSWTATACPGKWDLARVDSLARAKAWASDAPAPAAPSPVVPPATPAPVAQPGANQFRVDPGDTLGGIAAQFGVSLQGLINANPGIDPNKIYPGQILNFAPKPKPAAPARVPYCFVEAGDTLGGIAIQFGVSMARILAVNPGINPDRIYPGQRINL